MEERRTTQTPEEICSFFRKRQFPSIPYREETPAEICRDFLENGELRSIYSQKERFEKRRERVRKRQEQNPLGEIEGEAWKACIGFEALYEISDYGRVRKKGTGDFVFRYMSKDATFRCYRVALQTGERTVEGRPGQRDIRVHRLVYRSFLDADFVGILEPKDGNYINLRPGNWRPRSKRIAKGRSSAAPPKFSFEDAEKMRAEARAGMTGARLAAKYGVSPSMVSRVLANTRYVNPDLPGKP